MLCCRLQIFFLIIASCFFKYTVGQREITPLPLDVINRDSLNNAIIQKENKKDYDGLAAIYGGMFNYLYHHSDQQDSAIYYAGKAEDNSLKAGDSAKYYFLQLQLGEFNTGVDSQLAVDYYRKAFAFYTKTNNYTLQCDVLGGLSYLYGFYKDTSKLLKYLNEAEKIVAIAKDTFNIMGANDKRAHILMSRNKIDSAIVLFEKNILLIEHAKNFGNSESEKTFWMGLELNMLADCYYSKKNYNKAIGILKRAEIYNQQTSYFAAQNSFQTHLLVESFLQLDEKDSALKYLNNFFTNVNKEYSNLDPNKLREITEKYQAEKKQAQLEQLQQQNHVQQLIVSNQRKLNIAFIAILLLALISIFFVIKNIQQKRKMQFSLQQQQAELAKKAAVEKERNRISSELHDDVGGGLSSISLISEMMKSKPGSEISKQLNKISESSKELVQKMNEIVWALNINNDNLQSLLAYIRQYTVRTLDDMHIVCNINMPENIPAISIAGNDRRNIFLMVKECTNNIIKHSKASQVNIEISLNENLCIQIHDNGIGFSNAENDVHHFGLNNLKQRAKEVNGYIEWQQNSGTTVRMQMPLNYVSHKSVTF